ncbi:hypothetical protein [Aminobacter sp. MDW-2]|uniref:hypothetical protein n=1 Tax=Aminobacter sp. MDW-2 TaxID=2666139 RepID=UPI0012B07E97|nr:hypothetical protein [Aminobacter sp. MDW-2]MRX33839.1 hypothetical protein [Aminobacter sp. MDW-2]QNH34121.1 hypothetical protein H5P29_27320 [Aminobacter sp. MDW-2]
MPAYELGLAAATAACAAAGEVTINQDLDPLSAEDVVNWVNGVIDGVAATGRAIKGIRVETPTFHALGIHRDVQNSGRYRGIIVVETMLGAIGTPVEVVIAA